MPFEVLRIRASVRSQPPSVMAQARRGSRRPRSVCGGAGPGGAEPAVGGGACASPVSAPAASGCGASPPVLGEEDGPRSTGGSAGQAARRRRTADTSLPGPRGRRRKGETDRAGRRTGWGSGIALFGGQGISAVGCRGRGWAACAAALTSCWRAAGTVAPGRPWVLPGPPRCPSTRPKPLYSKVSPSWVLSVELPTKGRLEAGVASTRAIQLKETTAIARPAASRCTRRRGIAPGAQTR